ncbi:tRNA pseudouridine(55) synthase TruB [Paenibacillus sp. J5C_2022]|uniref:tRNA pseudouridine(55) synthase TruB n=1 Tax=Paenibacillus sp. J5C2022 TaxID=2977129 RepID=UPI0021D0F322|nr:tRNA pseudouridine(55) synthase TruB [Paenibacillus sp. J5C2022]MCU6707150.1 tRNA pseudouridine(55) synthase TruB [Paenibacillus sp. J5C2022]
MDGVLAVWKPEGWTSHDVVAKVRRIVRMKRIGHTGTLDPMVTGVLPLCLGRATRVVEYMQERPKSYEAVLKLGVATDTEDMTGTVLEEQPVTGLSEYTVREVLQRFLGEVEQVPPMYSAVKVDGKRLYELARAGQTVERKARIVRIHDISLLKTELDKNYPEIAFAVTCSKGTYIRTLCVDIGKALGVPAAMVKLVRTMSGGLTQADCLTIEQIEALHGSGELDKHLIAPDQAVSHLAEVTLSSQLAEKALRGIKIAARDIVIPEHVQDGDIIRVYDQGRRFVGLFQNDRVNGRISPAKIFS